MQVTPPISIVGQGPRSLVGICPLSFLRKRLKRVICPKILGNSKTAFALVGRSYSEWADQVHPLIWWFSKRQTELFASHLWNRRGYGQWILECRSLLLRTGASLGILIDGCKTPYQLWEFQLMGANYLLSPFFTKIDGFNFTHWLFRNPKFFTSKLTRMNVNSFNDC